MRTVVLPRLLAIGSLVSILLSGAAAAAPLLNQSRTGISFSRVASGVPVVQPVFLTNVGDAPLTISGLLLSGRDAADYTLGGTCNVPSTLPAGARCRVDVTESFGAGIGTSSATLAVQSDSSTPGAPIALSAILAPDLTRGLFPTPPWIDFDHQPVGVAAAPQTITLTNPEVASSLALIFDGVALVGNAAADFTLTSDCVVGSRYSTNASCGATIGFTPTANGPRSAEIVFQFHPSGAPPGFVMESYSVTGVGGTVLPVSVIEYYNAVLDHYFITWIAAEQANLDAGKTPTKWVRTGFTFNAYVSPQTGTSPVCRYYIPPGLGDSHFFGRGTVECNATGQKNPTFVLEDPAFMQMYLPTAGNCPANTTQIYRVFSNRPDANHRYTTSKAVRDQMVAMGWLAEGDGPDLVVMCAPQ